MNGIDRTSKLLLWLQDTWLYEVFYNALIGIAGAIGPEITIGISVILLTLIIKLLLSPLSYKAIIHQIANKKLEPERRRIQQEYKDDKALQAQKMMELMRESKTNPFSGCFLSLLQIPVIMVLYAVFFLGLSVQPDALYSFVMVPETLNLNFFGVDLGGKSIIFGVITGVTQLLQVRLSPIMQDEKKDATSNDTVDSQAMMMQSMQKSMKFTLPIMIAIFASIVPAAVALYWFTSNVFTIGQEFFIRRRLAQDEKIV